jgi:hypothetical protein
MRLPRRYTPRNDYFVRPFTIDFNEGDGSVKLFMEIFSSFTFKIQVFLSTNTYFPLLIFPSLKEILKESEMV